MTSSTRHNALEYEFLREQAGALGIAGRRLESALRNYNQHLRSGSTQDAPETGHLLSDLVDKAYALLLQREFAGFLGSNIEWLKAAYGLPPEALSRLGSSRPPPVSDA